MITTIDGCKIPMAALVIGMDDDLRERLHSAIAGWASEQEFYDAYAIAHKEKFGEDFIIN